MPCHPNLVTYITSVTSPQTVSVLMELAPGGSLASKIAEYGALPDETVRRYARDITCGLAFLHSHSIAHRDLKGAHTTGIVGCVCAVCAVCVCSVISAHSHVLVHTRAIHSLPLPLPNSLPRRKPAADGAGHCEAVRLWALGGAGGGVDQNERATGQCGHTSVYGTGGEPWKGRST